MTGNPLGDWLDDGDTADSDDTDRNGQSGRRRLGLLLGGGAVVWLIAAAVLFLGPQRGPAVEEISVAEPAGPTQAQAPEAMAGQDPSPEDAATPPPPLWETLPVGAAAIPPDIAAGAAVGLRLNASGGPDEGVPARYVDVAITEGGEQVGDLWVVRVIAVVLEGDGERWAHTRVLRYAVPMARAADGQPVVAGVPWVLPRGDVAPALPGAGALGWEQSDEPVAGVEEALADAGFTGVAGLSTDRSDEEGVVRAVFEAEAPPGRHEVWLSSGPRPRVLGGTASTTDEDWSH